VRAPAPTLDPDCLDALVAFADTMNLTAAAKALRRAQPTVHAQLSRLADAVGAKLYARRGRSLELTPEGAAVLAYARDSRARLDALRATLEGRAERRRVVLAAGEGALLYLLGPAIARFRARHPEALSLLIADRAETLAAVREARAQLGVTALEGADAEGLRAEPVASVGLAVVVSRGHPLAKKSSLRVADLSGVPLVLPPAPSALRRQLERALGAKLSVAIEARGWPLAMHCASLGLGVAVVNACCVAPKGCVLRPLRDAGPPVRYVMLSRVDAPSDPAVSALREAVLEGTALVRERLSGSTG
jgi:DNA-binding transcriptional LysR family regulator